MTTTDLPPTTLARLTAAIEDGDADRINEIVDEIRAGDHVPQRLTWTVEQLRFCHAAYVRGERDERTIAGHREWDRRRKARQRREDRLTSMIYSARFPKRGKFDGVTEEVRDAAVLEHLAGGTLRDVAALHGVAPRTLSRWVSDHRKRVAA